MDVIRRQCFVGRVNPRARRGLPRPAETICRAVTMSEVSVSEIPTSDWTWINAAADRFERAWKQGTRPRIEDYLAEVEESQRPALLEELLRVELELRRRDGEEPGPGGLRGSLSAPCRADRAVFGPRPDRSAATGPRHEPDPTTARRHDRRGGPTATASRSRALASVTSATTRFRENRPRRHGRRLPGPAGQPQPAVAVKMILAGAARRRPRSGASITRPRPRPSSTTPTSCRSTRSASTRASNTSR